jgi:hypothetical protein
MTLRAPAPPTACGFETDCARHEDNSTSRDTGIRKG